MFLFLRAGRTGVNLLKITRYSSPERSVVGRSSTVQAANASLPSAERPPPKHREANTCGPLYEEPHGMGHKDNVVRINSEDFPVHRTTLEKRRCTHFSFCVKNYTFLKNKETQCL